MNLRALSIVLGYCENPEDEKFVAPNVINKKPADELLGQVSRQMQQVEASLAALKAELGRSVFLNSQYDSDEEKLRPYGKYLESVSVYGYL